MNSASYHGHGESRLAHNSHRHGGNDANETGAKVCYVGTR